MLIVFVFEIKEGKNAQKVKKILTIIHRYLCEGDRNGRRPRMWRHTPPENFRCFPSVAWSN